MAKNTKLISTNNAAKALKLSWEKNKLNTLMKQYLEKKLSI